QGGLVAPVTRYAVMPRFPELLACGTYHYADLVLYAWGWQDRQGALAVDTPFHLPEVPWPGVELVGGPPRSQRVFKATLRVFGPISFAQAVTRDRARFVAGEAIPEYRRPNVREVLIA